MCVRAASEVLVGQGELGAAGRCELGERCKLPDKVHGRAALRETTSDYRGIRTADSEDFGSIFVE